jgi:hypothetical protein
MEVISKGSQQTTVCKGTTVSASESPSSTTTITSEDEALCELLRLDRFSLDGGNWKDDDNKEDKMETMEQDCKIMTGKSTQSIYICQHIPPQNCQRPNTLHTPLLLETSPNLLSEAQCSYIIHNLGYRTSNDGGKTYGPTYVKSARSVIHDSPTFNHSNISIDLRTPNPHKVCVFTSDLVLTWMERALQAAGLDPILHSWVQHNYNIPSNDQNHKIYRLHPRLRMLQYDAHENDIFPPHYDATTTWKDPHSGTIWESQLTVLLYLTSSSSSTNMTPVTPSGHTQNSKDVMQHPGEGGATRFQSILDPTHHHWDYTPQQGTILLFTHELYHSSQPLTRGIKLVLRTDVLFPPQMTLIRNHLHTNCMNTNNNTNNNHHEDDDTKDNSVMSSQNPTTTSATTLQQALDTFQMTSSNPLPLDWKQSLGLDPEDPISNLMSLGSTLFQGLLQDVGWDVITAKEFWKYCRDHYST